MWPEMQSPRLIIGKHACHGIDDVVRPRIDRNGVHFGHIRQSLPPKGQPQAVELHVCGNPDAFDLVLRRFRGAALQFIREERD